jgi:hypothetical protein
MLWKKNRYLAYQRLSNTAEACESDLATRPMRTARLADLTSFPPQLPFRPVFGAPRSRAPKSLIRLWEGRLSFTFLIFTSPGSPR